MSQAVLYKPAVNTQRLVQKVAKNIINNPQISIIELIANAWDAGATKVTINWPKSDDDYFFIEDNGCGMTDEDFRSHWTYVGYNRSLDQGNTIEINIQSEVYNRKTYGKNGIGKFAAFCFARQLNLITCKDGCVSRYKITENFADGLFDAEKISSEKGGNCGTRIEAVERKHIYCSEDNIISYVSQRFIALPNFEIVINGRQISLDEIPQNNIRENFLTISEEKQIKIAIVEKTESDATLRWSGIAWFVNGRRVGDFSWGMYDFGKIIDGRKEVAKKFVVIINADCLVDSINEDWTAFDVNSKDFISAKKAVNDYISSFLLEIKNENNKQKSNIIKNNTKLIREKLGNLSRFKVEKFIDEAIEKCPSIKESDLEHLVQVLTTLEATSGKFGIISKLSSFSVDEWEKLDSIISEWTITMAKEVLDEIQCRMMLITDLRKRVENNDTYEVQELQPIMEQCLWVLGPEFDSIEYTSNISIARCYQKYTRLHSKVFNVSANRPDFTILPDAAVSFYSTPSFDEESAEIGLARLIILELKAPSVAIGREEKGQPAKYYDEFFSVGMIDSNTKVTAYVLGAKKQKALQLEPTKEGNLVTNIMLFTTLLERAESRLFKLRAKIESAPFLNKPGKGV